MRRRNVSLLLVTGMLVLSRGKVSADATSDLAVIVNKNTIVQAFTSRDLRSVLLGEKDHWPNGQKVIAVSLSPEVPETKLLLKQICGMSQADLKRYFMQLAFQGKSASPPRFLTSPAAVRALVGATPGALGVIRARDVDTSVRVIPIDGGTPGAPNYKLAMVE